MFKKSVVILAVVLLFGLFPTMVSAENIVADGICGENANWVLTEDGTLTITGTGAIWNYDPYDTKFVQIGNKEIYGPPPWSEVYESITAVVIGEGITDIGENAFWSCYNMKSVDLPNSLEYIHEEAFSYCLRLHSIAFSENVRRIDYAFEKCYELEYITFYGDVPNMPYFTWKTRYGVNVADDVKINYRSSSEGWNQAKENWMLPDHAQWCDMDAAIGPDELAFEQQGYILRPGESIKLTHNADPYVSQFLTNFRIMDNKCKCVYLASDGTVSAIREGSATVMLSSKDGTYSAECLITVEAAVIPNTQISELDGNFEYNFLENDYTFYHDSPKYSFISHSDEESFDIVLYNFDGKVIVNRYDKNLTLWDELLLDLELPIFGGFFSGGEYNYLLYGKSNPDERDDAEVLRIVQYSKDWKRLNECSIFGANTIVPFNAGTVDFAEADGKLYIHTCHKMYADTDGINHQANMTFVIDQSNMVVNDCYYKIMNISYGYVSHSFSQRIRTNKNYVFRVDHGDAHLRAISLTRAKVDGQITDVEVISLFDIQGKSGDNDTGVYLGGLELSSNNCLVVGSSVDQSNPDTFKPYSGPENIFLCVADQELKHSETIWLTDYSAEDKISVKPPQLIKISDGLFMVMWSQYVIDVDTLEVYMVLIDGDGNQLCNPFCADLATSDCQPVLTEDGLISWYVCRSGGTKLYQISWQQLLRAKFSDVAWDSFYFMPVSWAVENSITNGLSATEFGPNATCNRAHVVTFLWRAAGQPEPTTTQNPFEDVKESDFYYKAVLWAVENGITNGMDATHFGPFTYCNRAQVVTFLHRAMNSPEPTAADCPFTDVESGAWYEAPILWAVEKGITNGMDATTFGVNTVCNRAQVVTFLYRTYVN